MTSVSAVIVSYNSLADLPACVESIIFSDLWPHLCEVIIVDNASTDGSCDVLSLYTHQYNKFKIIRLQKNMGFPYGCNRGVQEATGDLVLILNPDVRIATGFGGMLQFASSLRDTAAIQPTILYTDGGVESVGGLMDLLGHGFHLTVSKSINKRAEIFYAVFACVLVNKKIFHQVGGMNSSYFLYNDDLDFCWRAWLYGYKVVHYPEAKCFHIGQKSTRKVPSVSQYHMRKNRLAMIFVNYSPLLGYVTSIFESLMYFGGSFRSWVKGHDDYALFVYPVLWFAKNIQLLMRRQRSIQKKRVISDLTLFRKNFIVFEPVGLRLHLHRYRRLQDLAEV
jgi:N-acetylglucosaminyl-diphospho-decaprenol L-rhamnosyltransferase